MDDLFVVRDNCILFHDFSQNLYAHFAMKDLGTLYCFLGIDA